MKKKLIITVVLSVACSVSGSQLDSGLLLHYTFDTQPNNGLVQAATGNNAISYNLTWLEDGGVIGSAVKFNNDIGESYMRIIESADFLSVLEDEFTVAFWWDSGDGSGVQEYSNQALSFQPANEAMIHLPFRATGTLFWNTKNGSESLTVSGTQPSYYQGWNHWAFTKRAGEEGKMQIFRNGELIAQTSGTDWSGIDGSAVTDARIGGSSIAKVDDYRIYTRVLSSIEINMLYNMHLDCDPEIELLADINGDCVVDLQDFAILASEWLMSSKIEF